MAFLKTKYPGYITNNDTNAKFFTMLDTSIYPPETYGYVGYVTLPFYQNSSPLVVILPGTTPHFNHYLSDVHGIYSRYSDHGSNEYGWYERSYSMPHYYKTYRHFNSDFDNYITPLRTIVLAGAGGGGGRKGAVGVGQSGSGGGGGGG